MKILIINKLINYSHLGFNHNFNAYLFSTLHSHICLNNKNFSKLRINNVILKSNFSLFRQDNDLKYLFKTKKYALVTFDLTDIFILDFFKEKVYSFIEHGTMYYIIAKVNYFLDTSEARNKGDIDDSIVFTPKQIQLDFSKGDEAEILSLYKDLVSQLQYLLNKYNISEQEVNYIQLFVKKVDQEVVNDLKYNPQGPGITDSTRKILETKVNYFPFETDEKLLGKPLSNFIVDDGKIASLDIKLGDNKSIDFIENFNLKQSFKEKVSKGYNKESFGENTKFYYRGLDKTPYLLAIVESEKENVVKKAFSLKGNFLASVTDTSKNDKVISRSYGKSTFQVKDKEIVFRNTSFDLTSIKLLKQKEEGVRLETNNPNIGVIDLEVYMVGENNAKIMAAGLYVYNNEKPKTFYIANDKRKDSGKVVFDLLEEMFLYKYEDFTFYCHNLGGYDSVFLISAIYNLNLDYKDNNNFSPYHLDIICRKDRLLKLTISKKVNKKVKKVKILDSFAMLPESLKSLGKKFDVGIKKGDFPHAFSEKRYLFYVGDTPPISKYNNLSPEVYSTLVKKD